MLQRLHGDERGLTLIELMVAIIILGIIMMAMARSLITSLAAVQGQERQVLASAVMSEVLEQAEGVPFRSAGLCKAAAEAFFGAGSLNHIYQDGNAPFATITEPMVIIKDTDPFCDVTVAPLGPPPIVPSQTITRRGVPYTVVTRVSWYDDPSDGLGAADVNTTQDFKHVTVDVSWPVRTRTSTMRSETYIAPGPGEQPLRTEVRNLAAGSPTFTYIDDAGISESSVKLIARAIEPQSSVRVAWARRQPDTPTGWLNMVNPSGDKVTWEFTIQAGAAGNPYNKFPNGETIFEFEATAPDLKKISTFNRGLFVHRVPAITSVTASPSTVQVNSSGQVCGFDLSVVSKGFLPTDVTSITFLDGSPATRAFPTGIPTTNGANFSARVAGDPGFTPGTNEAIRVTLQRIADLTSRTFDLNVPVSSTVVPSCP